MRGLATLTGAQIVSALASVNLHKARDDEPTWADIPASSTIEWVPCYEKADCARLVVPMDYETPDGANVTLAVIRYRATDTENYEGPVFFHSGGTNSGIDWMANWADDLHRTVGYNHDIITWDPRSFSRSVPRISCWATEQRRNIWTVTSPGGPTQYDDLAYLATTKHRVDIENSACVDMMGDSGILEHVSSTHTARDLHSLMKAVGEEKIRYIGQSYGTSIGVFFASMYPDKVERMVCEGNLDPRVLMSEEAFTSLRDWDLLLDFFMESCAADERCAIHEPTAEAVRKRALGILENSRYNLAFVPTPTQFDYLRQPPTFSFLLGVLQSANSNPYDNFPTIAAALRMVEEGGAGTAEHLLASADWDGAVDFTDTKYRDPYDPDAGRKGFFNKYRGQEDWTFCNDLPPIEDDLEAFKEKMDELKPEGELKVASFASFIYCMGRKIRPKGIFKGPFGGNTSHPILFTNARFDPQTPAWMARANHKMFPGSGLLVYEAYGHSMVYNSPCVVEQIKRYFQTGKLPPEDIKCEDEYAIPWGESGNA